MRETLDPQASPSPSAPPTLTPTGPPTPPGGPVLATPMLGATGKARWEELARKAPLGGHEYNQWVLSLKDDPSDPEYQEQLSKARYQAQAAENKDKNARPFVKPGQKGMMATRGGELPPGTPPSTMLHEPKSGRTPGKPLNPIEEQKQAMAEIKGASGEVFVGTPTSQEGLATPSGEDLVLNQFMSINGKPLPGPQGEMAKRSGAFVYMGITTSTTKHGYSADTNQYMYYKDAAAGLTALGAAKVKEYQATLKMDQTGIPDDSLQNLWDKAVSQAQLYAKANIKMSVKEIFDSYVAANAAAAKGRGGGSGFVGDTPEEIAAIDYYKAMMAVLGDISGLPTPGGRG